MSDSEASSYAPTPTPTPATHWPKDKRWTTDLNFPSEFSQMQRQPTATHNSGESVKSTTVEHTITSNCKSPSTASSPVGSQRSPQNISKDTESIQGSPKVGLISTGNTNESPINRCFKEVYHTAISTHSGSNSPTMTVVTGNGNGASGEGTSRMSRSSSLKKKSALVEEKKKEYLEYQE
ncbi:uncharacterized protein L199_004174 [Kwoniella botswanensis]|uniref:uncharacterized protein n=1 Tax=Kwoniella botswanensis TaxID=1268659 RepID=UPI00315D4E63